MGLESSDCTFFGIVPVHMGGYQLVLFVRFFIDGLTIFCAGFVVQDLEVHFVTVLFDSPADVVARQWRSCLERKGLTRMTLHSQW